MLAGSWRTEAERKIVLGSIFGPAERSGVLEAEPDGAEWRMWTSDSH